VAHGVLMTGTRLIGLPLALCPLLRPTAGRGWASRIALAAAAALGGLAFFAYCQIAFGRWDRYLRTQAVGWGVVPDYFSS
jgi:hypothetical protein